MRSYAFLGDALLPYQRAVTAAVAARTGVAIAETVTCGLDELDAVAGGETALLYLCGLPYTRLRDRGLPLEPLAAPVSALRADDGPAYRSLLLGRPDLDGARLDELEGLRMGINGYDSMSGWVLAAGSGLPLERIASVQVTGAHRTSLDLLLAGAIDVALIDSLLLAGELLVDGRLTALPELAAYGPSPSPPVVLVAGDEALARALRDALTALHRDDEGRAALGLGAIARLDAVGDADYEVTRACDRRAAPLTP